LWRYPEPRGPGRPLASKEKKRIPDCPGKLGGLESVMPKHPSTRLMPPYSQRIKTMEEYDISKECGQL